MTVLISAYLGSRFSIFDIVRALFVVLAATALVSLAVILLQAGFAFDGNGVARGIFPHKNVLGGNMVLLLLCCLLLRSEEHTSELQSLMRISYAVFCLKKKKTQ